MPEKHLEITSFYWKGQLRYQCPMTWESGAPCEFNHFDLDQLKKHIAAGHKQLSGVKSITPPSDPPKDFTPHSAPAEFAEVKFASNDPKSES